MKINVNGADCFLIDADPGMPLLWALRDHLGLTGTKFGCGKAHCGACTVKLGADSVRSCAIPISAIRDRKVITIEAVNGPVADAVRDAWISHTVPQCGYCQSGQVMSAIALLECNLRPTRADIDSAMSGNICRCGTYPRIRAAIQEASQTLVRIADRSS